eukprot:EC852194.1.p1 GENE.EC852194.1~~EC852194.1.p1  ORF type:complete len:129 (-),score=25.07 EC852194.1:252-638(-)
MWWHAREKLCSANTKHTGKQHAALLLLHNCWQWKVVVCFFFFFLAAGGVEAFGSVAEGDLSVCWRDAEDDKVASAINEFVVVEASNAGVFEVLKEVRAARGDEDFGGAEGSQHSSINLPSLPHPINPI